MGRGRIVRLAGAACAALVLCTTCTDDGGSTELTAEAYVEQLGTICAETTATLEALPDPPDQISIADFATEAASALTDEAEQVRQLDPPDDLDADHRAFIANTDEQADAWEVLGATSETDAEALAAASTLVAELTLGRSDLAAQMGADHCVRAAG